MSHPVRPARAGWRWALTAALAASVISCGDSDNTAATAVPFTAADGASVTVSDFRGQPLVLNMWATNCAPCVKEMPAFDEVAREQSDRVAIIGVNVFDAPAAAAKFAADLGVGYPQYTDPGGELSAALSVTGLPATAFFDADGTLLTVHQGALTSDELRQEIERRFSEDEGTT